MGKESVFRLQGIDCSSWREGTCFDTVDKHTRRVGGGSARYQLSSELAKEQIN